MTTVALCWSKEYLSSPGAEDAMTVQINQRLWQEQMSNEFQGRLFVRIRGTENQEWVAPIGIPVPSNPYDMDGVDMHQIYLPMWMIDSARLQGTGETVNLDFMDTRDFESATRIVLRVVDSRFYNDPDVKQRLEVVLTELGVIRQGSLLQIPCADGQTADIYVSITEPSEYVLCEGEEVALEFEEPVDAPPPRPPTPIPSTPSFLVPEEFPSSASIISTAADTPTAPTGGFSGTGYRLGSGGADFVLPPWRQPGIKRRP
jgi:hypothetical protein